MDLDLISPRRALARVSINTSNNANAIVPGLKKVSSTFSLPFVEKKSQLQPFLN
jgi:hypothetical protein